MALMGPAGKVSICVASVCALVLCACRAAEHDLEVMNAWDRGVTVSVVSERAGLPDQAAPLGPVGVGATRQFASALMENQARFRFRYTYQSGIFAEHADVCMTREALREAGWRLVIPSSGHSCQ